MKIFITGASGFVGGAAAKYLSANGHEVLAMSRSASSDETIRSLGATPVRSSLGEVSPSLLSGVDAIIHAAAYVEEWGPYNEFYKANVTGTEQLLDAAKESGVKKFLHISTEAVLFNGNDLLNINEDTPYPKTNFYYPKTKQLAEKAVLSANNPGVFETVVVRPRLIWGPGDKTILPIIKEKVEEKAFMWIGGGNYKMYTTYIDNLVNGIGLALQKGQGGEIYFITDEEETTIKTFFTQLLQTQGVSIKAKSLPKWLARTLATTIEFFWKLFRIKKAPPVTKFAAAMMSINCTVNSDKAKRELGYRPAITIQQGLAEMTK